VYGVYRSLQDLLPKCCRCIVGRGRRRGRRVRWRTQCIGARRVCARGCAGSAAVQIPSWLALMLLCFAFAPRKKAKIRYSCGIHTTFTNQLKPKLPSCSGLCHLPGGTEEVVALFMTASWAPVEGTVPPGWQRAWRGGCQRAANGVFSATFLLLAWLCASSSSSSTTWKADRATNERGEESNIISLAATIRLTPKLRPNVFTSNISSIYIEP